ncbi:4-Cys prefix domain-containing protein [Scytonema sp. PRP1]|uniref:4-Cys prefix domain-containing protein n=1 Tax=Scytonema sp. PRP1 TaxID=3120513 RepID=UPI003FA7B576
MLYCLNPKCSQRQNSDTATKCEACNTPLFISFRISCPRKSCCWCSLFSRI